VAFGLLSAYKAPYDGAFRCIARQEMAQDCRKIAEQRCRLEIFGFVRIHLGQLICSSGLSDVEQRFAPDNSLEPKSKAHRSCVSAALRRMLIYPCACVPSAYCLRRVTAWSSPSH